MPHLSVLVPFEIVEHDLDLETAIYKTLVPYIEYCGSEDGLRKDIKPYVTFVDQEEDYRFEYDTECLKCIKKPNGELIRAMSDLALFEGLVDPQVHRKAKKLRKYPQELVPFKVYFPTFEVFMAKQHPESGRDKNTQRYGYFINPNGLWDWYMIGGRWSGLLKLRKDAENEGLSGLKLNGLFQPEKVNPTPGRVDIALASDIDWPVMHEEVRKGKAAIWYAWQECLQISKMQSPTEWQPEEAQDWWERNQDIHSKYSLLDDFNHLYAAKMEMEKRGYSDLSIETIIQLQNNLESFIAWYAFEPLVDAFIDLAGQWVESNRNTLREYHEKFWHMVNHLPAGFWIAVVDCHY